MKSASPLSAQRDMLPRAHTCGSWHTTCSEVACSSCSTWKAHCCKCCSELQSWLKAASPTLLPTSVAIVAPAAIDVAALTCDLAMNLLYRTTGPLHLQHQAFEWLMQGLQHSLALGAQQVTAAKHSRCRGTSCLYLHCFRARKAAVSLHPRHTHRNGLRSRL